MSFDLNLGNRFFIDFDDWVFNFSWVSGEEREIQKNYWKEHSADLSVEAMMLDSKAADLDKEERPEVKLSSLLFR